MMEKLERSQEMEAAERMKLEQEIRAKQEEVQRIQSEVEIKDAEARRLQEEVEAARWRNSESLFYHRRGKEKKFWTKLKFEYNFFELNLELINVFLYRIRQEEADRAFQASTTPQHHHVEENEEEGEEEGEDETPQGDVTKDLATDETIIDPVEERRTLAERNERLHDQLKVRNIVFIVYY